MPATSSLSARLTGGARTPDEIRDAVYLSSGDVYGKQTRFWLLLTLSAVIATAGVIGDSTATVIGAMIIAPLATPIQGIALAIAYGELRPLVRSAATLVGAVALVVGIGIALSALLPQLSQISDNSQITGRTSPTLIDLVAAAATGLAGAFAVARRDIADILPGVAIAISLVPPLAVVGITMQNGDFDLALGALLLFLTNVLAIIVAGVVLFGADGIRQGVNSDPRFRRRSVLAVVAIGCVTVVAALGAATFRAVQLSNRVDAATRVASEWADENGEHFVNARFDGDTLVLVVEGTTDGSQDSDLPGLLRSVVPAGTKVVVNRVAGSSNSVGDVGEG